MESLPPEILDRIFGELSVPDLLSARLVSRRWFDITCSFSSRLLYNLSIAPYATGMNWSDSCSSARTLARSTYPYEHFLVATNVLSSSSVKTSGELLPVFSRAVSLTFVGPEITEDLVGTLVRCAAENLRYLCLRNCNPCFMSGQVLKPRDGEEPVRLPELERLAVEDTRYLSDAILARFLAGAPNLRALSLAGCHLSSERVVYKRFYPPHLRQSPNESVLTTHMVLRLLAESCPGVVSLDVSRTSANAGFVAALCGPAEGPDGDNAGISCLELEEVLVDECYYLVEADVKRILARFPGLRVFRADKVRGVTDSSLLAAAPEGSLVDLRIGGNVAFTSAGAADVVLRNPGLESLSVSNPANKMAADFLAAISALANLTFLSLSGGKLTEAELTTLVGAMGAGLGGARVRTLDVSKNPGLTDRVAPKLIAAFPRLRVLRAAHCSHLSDAGLVGLTLNEDDEEHRRILYGIGLDGGDRASQVGLQALGYALRPDAEQRLVNEMGRYRLFKELIEGHRGNASLADLKDLIVLDLSYSSRVSDLTLRYGLNHPLMEFLDLSGCDVTDEGLRSLNATAMNLCELRLNQCRRLSDRALTDFATGARRLKRLSLVGLNQLTEETLSILPSSDFPNYRGDLLRNAGIESA